MATASLADLYDGRPVGQDQVFGWRTLTKVFENFAALVAVIRARHDNEGNHTARTAAGISGSYVWDGSAYQLEAQDDSGRLPSSIGESIAGQFKIAFVSALPETHYDVQLTGGLDATGKPGVIAYEAATRSTVEVYVRTGTVTSEGIVAGHISGFSVRINLGT